jgi:hypothetical protein
VGEEEGHGASMPFWRALRNPKWVSWAKNHIGRRPRFAASLSARGMRRGAGGHTKDFERGSMSKALDLTGQEFGELTALEFAEEKRGESSWRCRCSCGKEAPISLSNLRGGKTGGDGLVGGETERPPRDRLGTVTNAWPRAENHWRNAGNPTGPCRVDFTRVFQNFPFSLPRVLLLGHAQLEVL